MPALSRANAFLTKYMVFSACFIGGSIANGQDFIKPYVGTIYSINSNFFKVSDTAEAVSITGSNDKGEEVLQLYAGLDGEVPMSRQALEYGLRVTNNTHDSFDQLDNTGHEAYLNLDWRAGQTFSGDLGIKSKKSLTLFTETQSMTKDMRTVQEIYFKGTHRFHPDWYASGGLASVDISHNERERLSRDENRVWVEVLYASNANTRVGFVTSHAQGDYDETQLVGTSAIDNGYKSNNYSAIIYWEGSAKSALTARIGITNRKHDDLDDRDYNGSAWHLKYNWNATAKTKVDFSLWRDIGDYEEVLGFVKETGASIEPRLDYSPKLSFRMKLKFLEKRFEGDAETDVSNSSVREDSDVRITLKTVYKMTPKVHTFISYDNSERDSTQDISDYTSDIWRLGAELRF